MAWWFFLIIVSYVMIWLISGDQDTITSSLLALMGISAGTALGAVLIDSTGGSPALSRAATDRLALQAAKQNAQQAVNAAQATVAASPADPIAQKNLADAQAASAIVDAKLAVVNERINAIATVPQTRGFFRDILSDSNGTAGLHRFQIFVWTIVLGIIFLVSVVTELSMPEFSATLLAATGISAGTYLGFKFPEK
jgi:H+/gluconate symporter-like permease